MGGGGEFRRFGGGRFGRTHLAVRLGTNRFRLRWFFPSLVLFSPLRGGPGWDWRKFDMSFEKRGDRHVGIREFNQLAQDMARD